MRKFPFIFLLLAFPAHAAKVISNTCVAEVAANLEFRFTYNPNDNLIYAWERHYSPYLYSYRLKCLLYGIQPSNATITGFPVENVSMGLLRDVTNPVNGVVFKTNAVGIEQDQPGLDWCTQ